MRAPDAVLSSGLRALRRPTLAAAAIQYPQRHPAVTTVLIGPRDAGQVRQTVGWFEEDIPAGLWQTLEREGLAA